MAHSIRKQLMQAIIQADRKTASELQIFFYYFINNSALGILNRNKDRLRALKNIMLSYNSLYAYGAEEGGLDAVTAHYKAERYAVMFERATSENEIKKIYKECFEDYVDSSARVLIKTEGCISERVLEYINKNFTDKLSIEQIASTFHKNQHYLMRLLKKETGKTIQTVITEKRIQEACRLLETSNLSVTEIASMTGFNEPSLKFNSRTKYQFWRLLNSCALAHR
ncbi:helix-turn-helix transcriptional regulator [Treponema parvum]|uniref:Helix-turn-helix transcriptional regulator n=1 Tax=Treponema parvum TaxID=138851 RepID=A0A975F054_9SPIR|nr:AraC family transcriptional regulator [Treponema parvum]QTQ11928.1 helix-turn-helix transcriptional regulator [Treponema parvum]QTQ16096.1 helix-turn-helix transcriptional regulator [Treponema parvum]